jgi:ZIP family zinc transporter
MFGIVTLGILLPFIGTTLGAATVFLFKNEINPKLRKFLFGFAAGVMIAASIWSLILPAAELAVKYGQPEWLPPVVGFVAGMLFLLALDTFVPHQHVACEKPEGVASNLKKSNLLFMSVTLHNVPEGMAVGAVFAGLLATGAEMTLAAALSLSIGIALQNFPEGSIVSLPLKTEGKTKAQAFLFGAASGIVEPIAALVTIAFSSIITPVLGYLLAFAAGAMIYVVVEELIPESQDGKHSNIATLGVMLGFAIMMVLDMALG